MPLVKVAKDYANISKITYIRTYSDMGQFYENAPGMDIYIDGVNEPITLIFKTFEAVEKYAEALYEKSRET